MKNEDSKNLHEAVGHEGNPYKKLLIMLVLSFISMYILMYVMVKSIPLNASLILVLLKPF